MFLDIISSTKSIPTLSTFSYTVPVICYSFCQIALNLVFLYKHFTTSWTQNTRWHLDPLHICLSSLVLQGERRTHFPSFLGEQEFAVAVPIKP